MSAGVPWSLALATGMTCALIVLAGGGSEQSGAAGTRDDLDDLSERAPAREAARLEGFVLDGVVFDRDGNPVEGAVVVSSAGGQAVTDASGSYRLVVELPLDATEVQVTAVGRGGRNQAASTRVVLPPVRNGSASATHVAPLRLLRGSTCLPSWLPTFGERPGIYRLNALVAFDGGGSPVLYAAGEFGLAGSTVANRVARLEGSTWSPLGSGMNLEVSALTMFDDGSGPKLYAGGNFTVAGAAPATRVARWNGSSWSALTSPATSLNDRVQALAVYDDGRGPRLYAGGRFTGGVAKFDGSSWSTVGGGVAFGPSTYEVNALAVFDDGGGPALYAGGRFGTAGGAGASHIAKWNGSSWSPLGSGTNNLVRTLAVFDDGTGPELYAAGSFTTAGGVPASRIARWDGSSWSVLGSGIPASAWALAVYDDGSGPALYAGGPFAAAGGLTATLVEKWDGSNWSQVGGYQGELNTSVAALAVYDDGSGPALFAGGSFVKAENLTANGIAKWSGSSWSTLGAGLIATVRALAVFDDGSGPALYVAADTNENFYSFPMGVEGKGIAKWDGTSWSALGSGVEAGGGHVHALLVFDDGSGPALYAGGDFGKAGGALASRVAKWNGSAWTALGSGLSTTVFALAVFDDGGGPALYAGGQFTRRVAKWNGSSWSELGTLTGLGAVLALAVYDDGGGPALYAGGSFDNGGGLRYLAKWNGSTWSTLGSGPGGAVSVLLADDLGGGAALYAGGSFGNGIKRWDGTTWSNLGLGLTGPVYALAKYDDGSGLALYAGGAFESVGGGPVVSRIARWNGSSWSALGSGAPQVGTVQTNVNALAAFDDGSAPALYAGGAFVRMLDSGDSNLAKWGCPDTVAPSLSMPASVRAAERPGSAPGELVSFTVTASDDQDPSPAVVCVPASGSFFARGTTLVTCTATDASGNQSVGQFPVTVELRTRARGR